MDDTANVVKSESKKNLPILSSQSNVTESKPGTLRVSQHRVSDNLCT